MSGGGGATVVGATVTLVVATLTLVGAAVAVGVLAFPSEEHEVAASRNAALTSVVTRAGVRFRDVFMGSPFRWIEWGHGERAVFGTSWYALGVTLRWCALDCSVRSWPPATTGCRSISVSRDNERCWRCWC